MKEKNAIGIDDKSFVDNYKKWDKIRDFIAGADKVREYAEQKEYLEFPANITASGKRSYINRAFFPQLVAPALNDANGRILQEPAKMPTFPENFKYFLNDVTGDNTSLYELMNKLISNLNSITRCGVLVDFENLPEEITQAEAEELKLRPYWTFYSAFDIRQVRLNNIGKPRVIVLSEKIEIKSDDFQKEDKTLDARRVLFLNQDGIYHQQLFVYNDKTSDYEPYSDPVMVLKNGSPMNYIPFFFFNGAENNHEITKPRLQDITESVNSLYKNWADMEYLIYNICIPIRYVTGVTKSDMEVLGTAAPNTIWYTTNPDSKFGVLDVTGQGLTYAIENIKNKLDIAKRQGFIFLDAGVRTATQIVSENNGRMITLTEVAKSVENGLNECLRETMEFMNITFNEVDHTVKINLQTEDSTFEANNFTAMINAYNSGLARLEDIHQYQLKKKITNETDFTVWRAGIEESITNITGGGDEL